MSLTPWLALALTITQILAAGCQPAADLEREARAVGAPEQPRATKRITAAIKGEPKTLSRTVSGIGSGQVQGSAELERLINTGLSLLDDSGTLRPGLAEQIPSPENGLWKVLPDGTMETIWRIRPQAQWHDGAPFTASDLVFTAAVEQDAEIAVFKAPYSDFISGVVATDPTTVTVTWNRLFIGADQIWEAPIPVHLLGGSFAESKARFADVPYWTVDFVGTGPFRVREFVVGSHVVLEANERYPLGRPRLDEIGVRFIADPNTMVANVLAGAVHLTLGTAALPLQTGLQIRDQWSDGRVEVTPVANFLTLYPQFMNPEPAIIADLRFRRALLHATDRQELVDTLVAGLSLVAHSLVSPRDPEFQAVQGSIVRHEYDPRKAVEILDGLGYSRRSDGWFYDASNRQLSVPIQASGANAIQVNTMLPVAAYWQRVGVGVTTLVIPPQQDSDRAFRAERPGFELARQVRDIVLRANSTREAALPENNYRGINRARYMNPDYDALLDRYYVTIPRTERLDVLGGMIHHLTDQLPLMTLYFDVAPTLIDIRLVHISNGFTLWNVQEWDVR
jgi:peptide/nickel transport system substrate-binding protein